MDEIINYDFMSDLFGNDWYNSSRPARETWSELIINHIVDFLHWIHNNWFVPYSTDFLWKMDIGNPEFSKTLNVDKNELWDTKELYTMFCNKEGEF